MVAESSRFLRTLPNPPRVSLARLRRRRRIGWRRIIVEVGRRQVFELIGFPYQRVEIGGRGQGLRPLDGAAEGARGGNPRSQGRHVYLFVPRQRPCRCV
ncbi:MAG TPA: hypothetical protein VJ207_02505, partial [Thermoplasmata archaeon]|nr:hypothetical protein [Thermoplasmata archaeon]